MREVVEGSTDDFTKGFELCWSQVQNFFPEFDISQLKEFSNDDEDDLEDLVEAEAGEIMEASERVAESDVNAKVGAEEISRTSEEATEAEVTEDLLLIVERQRAYEAEREK